MRGLTEGEQLVLDKSAELVAAWAALPHRLQCDNDELEISVHRIQSLVGMRVARRVDPYAWRQEDPR